MTDTQLTIIIASVPTTIAAIGTLIVSVISTLRGEQRGRDAAKATQEIHTIVNSKADNAANKIEALQTEVKKLTATAADNKETAALLAQKAETK